MHFTAITLLLASSLTSSLALPGPIDSTLSLRDIASGAGATANTSLALRSDYLSARATLDFSGDCTHHAVSTSDVQKAVNNIAAWCDQGNYIQPGYMQWFWVGSGMAYICAYGGSVACSGSQIRSVYNTLVQRCGNTQGSWYRDGPFSFGTDPWPTCECGGICPK